jgi:RNA recognition motif-containing protein
MSRLFIGNLPNDSREDDVRRVFGEKAQIRELILKNGYAFIVRGIEES